MIKHAIVGCGRIAASHADAFRWAGSPIASCTDIVAERAHGFAQKFEIPDVADSFDSLLRSPDVTSVSLCVPHDLHAPMALEALAAGKHVLVEKPVVLDPADGPRIAEAAGAAGLVAMPVVQHRFDPLIVEISRLVSEGCLGPLRFVRAHLECVRPQDYYRESDWRGLWAREGGSVLINQGYHLLDLLLFLAGPVEKLSAEMATFAPPEVMETEDAVVATLRFRGGALGCLDVNGAAGSPWNSFVELMGSRGELAFTINYPNTVLRFRLDNKRDFQQWRRRLDEACVVRGAPPPGLDYYGVSHREQARAFVERVGGGGSQTPATLEEAVETVRVAQSIYRSAGLSRSPAGEGESAGAGARADEGSTRAASPKRAGAWRDLWEDVRGDDASAVAELVARGEVSVVSGGLLDRFEEEFAAFAGASYGVAFCNGTSSLYAALWAAGVRAGDEVLVCDYGFHGMAAAVLSLGARLVVCDCLGDSLVLDPEEVRRKRTPRTKAVLLHNPWGVPAFFDHVREAAEGLVIISDASHAHGATFGGRPLGAWADVTCFSLGRFKLVSGGELGCAVTDSVGLRDRMLLYGHVNRVPLALRASGWRGNAVGLKFRPHALALPLALSQLARVEEKLALSRSTCSRLESIFERADLLPQSCGGGAVRSYWKLVFRLGRRWDGVPTRVVETRLRVGGLPVEANHYWPLLQDQAISGWDDYRGLVVRAETPVAHAAVPRTVTLEAPVALTEESYTRTEEILNSALSQS
ncbi:MAG TPA: aminotransferase class I/II-fold pyridoxal phosphate-dependent enzyme [Pyrinomonadaceae bacterium]|nr:aminotransferase class I/II-fold pyridoxal phosphate-dependent enzyme [Pyrinomonadaceae bacterium]